MELHVVFFLKNKPLSSYLMVLSGSSEDLSSKIFPSGGIVCGVAIIHTKGMLFWEPPHNN